ncbi:hypothetical protein Back2_17600 [Nocardioides baekrokdamisoli]|uniref:Uncharacterized protein n=1 Tax=Nocardioides baekrokdamisoli TaxID=1804624 RepID=A0A3G9IYG9_9ACTN|nr:hypothetical protein Back2_17600 [Nocardioides baekrokdamisoli]
MGVLNPTYTRGPGGIAAWLYRKSRRADVEYAFNGDSYKTAGRRTRRRPKFTPTVRDRSLSGKTRRVARKAAS